MRSFDRSQRLIRYRSSDRTTWPGMAFILESLLLLLFVSASLAVLMSLFVQANLLGEENVHRSEAIVVASNVAELFAQDPTSVAPTFEQGGYHVTCETHSESTEAGTFTLAHIGVSLDDNLLYELSTGAYQSDHSSRGAVEVVEVQGLGESVDASVFVGADGVETVGAAANEGNDAGASQSTQPTQSAETSEAEGATIAADEAGALSADESAEEVTE